MGIAPTIQHRPVMEQDICALLLHDRLALPVENNGLPSSGANVPGSPFTTR